MRHIETRNEYLFLNQFIGESENMGITKEMIIKHLEEQLSKGEITQEEFNFIKDNIDKIPVYECEKHKRHWRFYCKKCKTYHYHAPEEGIRTAHCADGTSYYIVLKRK